MLNYGYEGAYALIVKAFLIELDSMSRSWERYALSG